MSGLIYESARAKVIWGDAREVLEEMETESVDLVIADPPYGVEWQSNLRAARFDMLAGDGAADREGVQEILTQCVRLVGQRRHLYVFGPTDVLPKLKTTTPVELVWDKGRTGAGDLTAAWGPAHEPIAFMVSNFRHGGEAHRDQNVAARLRKGSVIRFYPPTGRRVRHPTEKPWELCAELVESSTRADELVLDPCAGSGSVGVAAVLRGRRAVLVEIDERYARLAADRVRRAEALVDGMEGL